MEFSISTTVIVAKLLARIFGYKSQHCPHVQLIFAPQGIMLLVCLEEEEVGWRLYEELFGILDPCISILYRSTDSCFSLSASQSRFAIRLLLTSAPFCKEL